MTNSTNALNLHHFQLNLLKIHKIPHKRVAGETEKSKNINVWLSNFMAKYTFQLMLKYMLYILECWCVFELSGIVITAANTQRTPHWQTEWILKFNQPHLWKEAPNRTKKITANLPKKQKKKESKTKSKMQNC